MIRMKSGHKNYKKLILKTSLIFFFLSVYSLNASSSSVEEVEFPSAKKRSKRNQQSSTLEELPQKYRCVPAGSKTSQSENLQVRKPQKKQSYSFKYAQGIKDFNEFLLYEDQRHRLLKLCEVPLKHFNLKSYAAFKVVYYVMIGKNHHEIAKILKLSAITNISAIRFQACEEGFLTPEEIRFSGGRLEVMPGNEDISPLLYKNYAEKILKFDESRLSLDQRERLMSFCKNRTQHYRVGRENIFKVIYYVMLGKHLKEIQKTVTLNDKYGVSSAFSYASQEEYLTAEEVLISREDPEIFQKSGEISLLILYELYTSNISKFDQTKLLSEQAERLQKLVFLPKEMFDYPVNLIFKVVYYIMIGTPYHEIPHHSGVTDLQNIINVGRDAYKKGFLTDEEMIKGGLEIN